MTPDASRHLAGAGVIGGSTALLAVAVVLVAAATLAGAWLARRRSDQRQVWFGAAAGSLLVIALMHLLPDAWSGARDAGLSPWLVPGIAVVSFGMNVGISRLGCTCQADREHVGGTGSAAALALHRFLEGAALALSGLVTAVALAVHALGEGMAVGALLGEQRRRLAIWLAVMCCGPAVGAAAVDAVPGLDVLEPLLLAVAAGVLAQAARISLGAAFRPTPAQWRFAAAPATATVLAAGVTALAVYGVG